jgi:hypothetical protein
MESVLFTPSIGSSLRTAAAAVRGRSEELRANPRAIGRSSSVGSPAAPRSQLHNAEGIREDPSGWRQVRRRGRNKNPGREAGASTVSSDHGSCRGPLPVVAFRPARIASPYSPSQSFASPSPSPSSSRARPPPWCCSRHVFRMDGGGRAVGPPGFDTVSLGRRLFGANCQGPFFVFGQETLVLALQTLVLLLPLQTLLNGKGHVLN